MTIEEQIADEVLNGPWKKRGYEIASRVELELRQRISDAIHHDRERAARILEMAPLDMSLEQLAVLIRKG